MDVLVESPRRLLDPSDSTLVLFDYSRIHPRYHAASSPSADIVLYKGGVGGAHETGFLSNALLEGRIDHLLEIRKVIEKGDEAEIRRVFDRHTTYYGFTPFLSTTFNPQMAQVFASTHPLRKKDMTIYELRIKAERCIVDIYDTGACGESKEVLVWGAIFPDEIRRIKIINDDRHSELFETQNGTSIIQPKPDKNSRNTSVKDPENWLRLDLRRLRNNQSIAPVRMAIKEVMRKVA
jgi:hypothetical protein